MAMPSSVSSRTARNQPLPLFIVITALTRLKTKRQVKDHDRAGIDCWIGSGALEAFAQALGVHVLR
jgi:hypothetical protein